MDCSCFNRKSLRISFNYFCSRLVCSTTSKMFYSLPYFKRKEMAEVRKTTTYS